MVDFEDGYDSSSWLDGGDSTACSMQPPGHPGSSITLCAASDENITLTVLRRMREVLRGGWTTGPDVEVSSTAGGGARINCLMLTMSSAAFRRTGGGCLGDLSRQAADADAEVLAKLRELVHVGRANFGRDSRRFFQAFHIVEVLDMPECYAAFCKAAQRSRPPPQPADYVVTLELEHEEKLLGRLMEMYGAYPGNLPCGFFDTHFVPPGSQVPCAQAHRLVLAAASGYFRALWEQEAQSLESQGPWRIEMQDVSEAVLRAVLDFTYRGRAHVPRQHFVSLALQADGWQLDALFAACQKAVLESKGLAALVLHETTALPDNMTVAVAYSLPKVVKDEDDVDAFIMLLRSPVLATHLSTHFRAGSADDWDGFSAFGPMASASPMLMGGKSKGKGKGKHTTKYGKGAGTLSCEDIPVGTQLEHFIEGRGFHAFLEKPAALKLPMWSVAMVLESFMLQLTHHHPHHPSNQQPRVPGKPGKGKGRTHSWAPPQWHKTSEEVATWLLRWAEAQAPESTPSTAALELPVSPTLRHLVSMRGLVRHHRGAVEGEHLRRTFWKDLFRSSLRSSPGSTAALLSQAEAHFGRARTIPETRFKGGKGYSTPARCQAMHEWSNVHSLYEAAFLDAAGRMLPLPCEGGAGEWPWWRVSGADFLRLLASEDAPQEPAALEAVLRCWLAGSPRADAEASRARALDFAAQVARGRQVLAYPLRSVKAPPFLRYIVPAENALCRVAEALDRLAAAASAQSGGK